MGSCATAAYDLSGAFDYCEPARLARWKAAGRKLSVHFAAGVAIKLSFVGLGFSGYAPAIVSAGVASYAGQVAWHVIQKKEGSYRAAFAHTLTREFNKSTLVGVALAMGGAGIAHAVMDYFGDQVKGFLSQAWRHFSSFDWLVKPVSAATLPPGFAVAAPFVDQVQVAAVAPDPVAAPVPAAAAAVLAPVTAQADLITQLQDHLPAKRGAKLVAVLENMKSSRLAVQAQAFKDASDIVTNGRLGVGKDPELGFALVEKAVELSKGGNAQALFNHGYMKLHGLGTERDPAAAEESLKKAAAKGAKGAKALLDYIAGLKQPAAAVVAAPVEPAERAVSSAAKAFGAVAGCRIGLPMDQMMKPECVINGPGKVINPGQFVDVYISNVSGPVETVRLTADARQGTMPLDRFLERGLSTLYSSGIVAEKSGVPLAQFKPA